MRSRDVKPGMQLVIIYLSAPKLFGIAIKKPYREPGERYYRIPVIGCDGIRIDPKSFYVYEYRNGKIIW